jgi:transketolase
VSPRLAYRDALLALLAGDARTVCLDSDTGLFTGADFGAAAGRYLNLGIAEQSLMGAAAGLAAGGARPFVHTMATFAASRALEFVKLDIAYNALPVRIAATHAGVSAGRLGPTHHALEDLAVMRMLPNMTVVVPGDAQQVRALLDQAVELPGPLYLRLDRGAADPLPHPMPAPVLGRLQVLQPGGEVVLAATGPQPLAATLAAAELLRGDGLRVTVLHVHTLAPFDTPNFVLAVASAALVVSVESHWATGGLGSTLAEALCSATPRRLLRIGIPRTFVSLVGDEREILAHHGVSGEEIHQRVLGELGLAPPAPTPTRPLAAHPSAPAQKEHP